MRAFCFFFFCPGVTVSGPQLPKEGAAAAEGQHNILVAGEAVVDMGPEVAGRQEQEELAVAVGAAEQKMEPIQSC